MGLTGLSLSHTADGEQLSHAPSHSMQPMGSDVVGLTGLSLNHTADGVA